MAERLWALGAWLGGPLLYLSAYSKIESLKEVVGEIVVF
jgi:hypothetical protein